eukprot:1161516-Pelagomonas_calceolata.AAC.3
MKKGRAGNTCQLIPFTNLLSHWQCRGKATWEIKIALCAAPTSQACITLAISRCYEKSTCQVKLEQPQSMLRRANKCVDRCSFQQPALGLWISAVQMWRQLISALLYTELSSAPEGTQSARVRAREQIVELEHWLLRTPLSHRRAAKHVCGKTKLACDVWVKEASSCRLQTVAYILPDASRRKCPAPA